MSAPSPRQLFLPSPLQTSVRFTDEFIARVRKVPVVKEVVIAYDPIRIDLSLAQTAIRVLSIR